MISKHHYVCFFTMLAILFYFSPISGTAEMVTLYDQPNAQAKAIGTLDLSVGIIPIFKPKEGTWVKVADPRNGNVGWIKVSDVTAIKPSAPVAHTLPNVTDGTSSVAQPNLPPIISQPNLSPSDQAKVDAMVKQMQLQEQAVGKYLQQFMSQSIDQMIKTLNEYNQQIKKQETNTTTAPSSQPSALEMILKQGQKPVTPPVNQPVPINK